MREVKKIFDRVYRDDTTDKFEEPVNVFRNFNETPTDVLDSIGEGEMIIQDDSNELLVKRNGVLNNLAIVDGEIKLREI